MKQLSLTTQTPTQRSKHAQPDVVVFDAETEAKVMELMARAMIAIVRGPEEEARDDR